METMPLEKGIASCPLVPPPELADLATPQLPPSPHPLPTMVLVHSAQLSAGVEDTRLTAGAASRERRQLGHGRPTANARVAQTTRLLERRITATVSIQRPNGSCTSRSRRGAHHDDGEGFFIAVIDT